MADRRTSQDTWYDPSHQEIGQALNTPAKIALAVFLHANPYTYDHAAGLAKRLDQPVAATKAAADDLVAAGILLKMGQGPHALYALNVRHGWDFHLSAYFACQAEHPPLPIGALASLL